MKKGLIIYILTFVLCINNYVIATTEDLKKSDANQAINVLQLLNIVKGYEDKSLELNKNISREEFTAIAIRTMGLENAAQSVNTDIQNGLIKFKGKDITINAKKYLNYDVEFYYIENEKKEKILIVVEKK